MHVKNTNGLAQITKKIERYTIKARHNYNKQPTQHNKTVLQNASKAYKKTMNLHNLYEHFKTLNNTNTNNNEDEDEEENDDDIINNPNVNALENNNCA